MPRVQVGDVVRMRIRWGRLPTSFRYQCPMCRGFVKRGATYCGRCRASFDYVTDDFAQVTGIAAP